MDEAEDETNPREFGGDVEAMSRIREIRQHTISETLNTKETERLSLRRSARLTAIFDVWRYEEVLLMEGVSV